ncbi:MAG: hypothetical protein IT325_04495 [Anaerolineae bacterium]|nr:hypothetical protein [Anaerolineae bacterium]
MPTVDDLLNEIFAGKKSALYAEFEGWVRSSRRFRAFATDYRTKIRAKLRNASDPSRQDDLRAELETAAILLAEPRFTVEYERYAALKQRGPDFTVTFKTHTPFNVEVRHLRSAEMNDGDEAARIAKLMAVLCDKAGQMQPSIVNLLWLAAARTVAEEDISRAAHALLQLAERKTEEYFTRCGFESALAFLKQHQRLSGIAVRQPGRTTLWLNPLARHKVPLEIANAINRLA